MTLSPVPFGHLHSMLLDQPSLWHSHLGAGQSPLMVVDLDGGSTMPPVDVGVPLVIVGITDRDVPEEHPAASACDIVLTRGDSTLDMVADSVRVAPIAATSLAVLLRGAAGRVIGDGLLLESATYSALQCGREFARWRAERPPRVRPDTGGPAVLVEHVGQGLELTLNRPQVRNAVDTRMRDELSEAFRLVAMDPSIREVHVRGAGEAFCAGGDLDEFGSFPDAATAHIVRLVQSVGRSIAEVADRVTMHLHGACFGSGIELPAFAGTVLAAPDTLICLPELRLGLIPGAGGTVSLPRRIGRHRAARLAFSGERLDARTALDWGLIDGISTDSADERAQRRAT